MKKRIMVVDDVADTVEIVKVVLEANGFEALPFTQPKKALEALKEDKQLPDFLLLDMRMPEVSGPDFAEKVRADPKLKKLKIAFFTASSDSDPTMLKRYGAVGYIFKPFDVQDLVKQIKGYLAK